MRGPTWDSTPPSQALHLPLRESPLNPSCAKSGGDERWDAIGGSLMHPVVAQGEVGLPVAHRTHPGERCLFFLPDVIPPLDGALASLVVPLMHGPLG